MNIEAQPLPLFYSRIVPLDARIHGGLKLNRAAGFSFATSASAVPVGVAEFAAASQSYPILFTSGPDPVPVVLLGARPGENLFVSNDGTWQPESYIPAYARAYPFIFIEDGNSKQLFLGVEADAKSLDPSIGIPLFEGDKPSPGLNEVLAFCGAYREALQATRIFGKALEDAGLMEDYEATINFAKGGAVRINGFRVVSRKKFDALDSATFLEFRRKGWLDAIYAHFFSAGRWNRIVDLAAAKRDAVH